MSNTKVYQIITDRLISMIEAKGVLPWQRPWKSGLGSGLAGMNLVSKKKYRGINAWMTDFAQYSFGYTSPYWMTFKQARALGGCVRKGEHGIPILFFAQRSKEKVIDRGPKAGETAEETFLVARYYTVFNVQQVDGLEPGKVPEVQGPPEEEGKVFEPIMACEQLLAGVKSPPAIAFGVGDRACYSPSPDSINMPDKSAFKSAEFMYAVLFHELGHATGHVSRLNRKTLTENLGFGTAVYSKEELVAEFTSAFLCGQCRIDTAALEENAAAYLANWLSVLKKDGAMLVKAASEAQKAADWLLGVKREEEESREEKEEPAKDPPKAEEPKEEPKREERKECMKKLNHADTKALKALKARIRQVKIELKLMADRFPEVRVIEERKLAGLELGYRSMLVGLALEPVADQLWWIHAKRAA